MKLIIPGELTNLNTYIDGERANRHIGAKIKKEMTNYVTLVTKRFRNGNSPIDSLVRIYFTWYTKDLRTDPDNTAFAKKFILDGIVKAGILKNDSRKYIKSLADDFDVDKQNPRIEVEIVEV